MIDLRTPGRRAGASFLALAAAFTASLSLPGHSQGKGEILGGPDAPGKQVVVANTAKQPVPVAVQGTPNVRAAQNGSWSVTVDNTPAAPVPTFSVGEARESFQAYLAGYGASVMVPSGKRLVIEHVGLYAQIRGNGVAYSPAIRTRVNGVHIAHQLSFDHSTYLAPPASGLTRSEGSKSVHLYADPDTKVDFLCLNEAGSDFYCAASISGYLVPVQ